MEEKSLILRPSQEISPDDLLIVELDDRLELAALVDPVTNNGCPTNGSACNSVAGCGGGGEN